MAKPPGRPISGIVLLDKWLDVSSNHALQWVKRLYQAKKVGHTGSLDSLATGMLPICFGRATKFCQFLLNADKVYEVCLRWGVTTNTGDAEGDVVARSELPLLNETKWEGMLAHFRGVITQVPSMFSALKYQGKPLYSYARQGIEVPRKSRQITIHELHCVYHDASSAVLRVRCSKGTYIRTLVEDMGQYLGCGAHVMSLRRLGVGSYAATDMVSWSTLKQAVEVGGLVELDQYVRPIHSMMTHWSRLILSPQQRLMLAQRGRCLWPHDAPSGMVRLDGARGEFWGIGSFESGQLRAECLLRQAEQYVAVE